MVALAAALADLIHDERLVLPMDHDVVALDSATGTELWRYRLDQEDLCEFAAATGKPSSTASICCREKHGSGSSRWTTRLRALRAMAG